MKMTPDNANTGTYKFEIEEHGVGLTKTGKPQCVLRLKAKEYYVEDLELIKHFDLEGPGWVDWSEFDHDTTAFLVLFSANVKDGEQCVPGENDIFWYESLQEALGWGGDSFDELNGEAFKGKIVQAYLDQDEWDGKVRLQVKSLSDENSSPTRELKKLDTAEVKKLDGLLVGSKKKAAKVAKPAGKPKPAPAAKKPAGNAGGADESAETPAASAAGAKTSENTAAVSPTKEDTSNLTKEEVWEWLYDRKGDNEDDVIVDAFGAAMAEIAEDSEIGEDEFTGDHWAKVRDVVRKDLSIK